ncbi:TPA: hypothetical protein ACHFM6_000231 [Enterobacter hormaechei]
MTERADSITVRSIITKFLEDEYIKSRLRLIKLRERNDWEKWLQVELEYFISQSPGVHVEREVKAIPDNRMLPNRSTMSVDLIFSKSKQTEKSYIFLEFKCTKNVQALINGFNLDIDKINSIKSCKYDFRSFWCVGFHLNCSKLSINRIKNHVAKYPNSYHDVIKLCDCVEDIECDCDDMKIGFAII